MDPSLEGFNDPANGWIISDRSMLSVSDLNIANGLGIGDAFVYQNDQNVPYLPLYPISGSSGKPSNVGFDGDSAEDFDNLVLKYISDVLMEEDVEEKTGMFQESLALQAAERSFYDVLMEKRPPLGSEHNKGSSYNSHNLVHEGWNIESDEYKSLRAPSHSISQTSSTLSNRASYGTDWFVDSSVSTPRVPEIVRDNESVIQFKRGVEEASKFLPCKSNVFVALEADEEENKGVMDVVLEVEKKPVSDCLLEGPRGRKNPHPNYEDLEGGRRNKQSAAYTETAVSPEMFDMLLMNCASESEIRVALRNGVSDNMELSGQAKGSSTGGRSRGKKRGGKKDVVDLRTLLTLCAQAVAANDRRTANELLKQIRQHSTISGDGMQRLATYFANGLEARLAGYGTQIYKNLLTIPKSAADILKAYHLYLAACPFKKLSNFFSNKTIMNAAENAKKLHIIEFGIRWGFQWPCFIQGISTREGGPPKLKITGIEFPEPGFRPAATVEETGRRLANYANTFNVPFEFNAIAKKWDTVKVEDLKLDSDELLVVSCMYRFRSLHDETVLVESPRDMVLNLIRKINPSVFILGIVNGRYNGPFFITRFREALFHFSTLFDMLETNVPREIPERMLIEREIFGQEAMNVIACEGQERIERPETYKQWQVRNTRAGFRQLPLNREIMNMAKERVKENYHKDFIIDEDSQWLLQGWRGRIVYCLSSWQST